MLQRVHRLAGDLDHRRRSPLIVLDRDRRRPERERFAAVEREDRPPVCGPGRGDPHDQVAFRRSSRAPRRDTLIHRKQTSPWIRLRRTSRNSGFCHVPEERPGSRGRFRSMRTLPSQLGFLPLRADLDRRAVRSGGARRLRASGSFALGPRRGPSNISSFAAATVPPSAVPSR